MSVHELSREKLRILRSLASSKIRRKRSLCIVEGERALEEALRSRMLQYLVVEKKRAALDLDRPLLPLSLDAADLPLYTLEKGSFNELSDVRSGTGLIGVAKLPVQEHYGNTLDEDEGRIFLLDGVQEPGNVGTLIRTAWALGFSSVLLGPGAADPFSQKGIRASAGAVFHLPLYDGFGQDKLVPLLTRGYGLYYAEGGGMDYRKIHFPDKAILALGNEGAGVSSWVRERGTAVGIPMAEGVDSLNVVVAGGIIAAAMISD